MQIDDDLQVVVAGPLNSFVEVWELTLDVGFTLYNVLTHASFTRSCRAYLRLRPKPSNQWVHERG